MNTHRGKIGPTAKLMMIGAMFFASAAYGADFGGTVTWIEVWRTGNVAFRLSDASSATTCNGQFILNASDPGFKNQYAALIAAKRSGTTVSVLSGSCGPADNYGGNYIIVNYLYLTQD